MAPEPLDSRTHKGWYSRGYLPHLDEPNVVQGITFRLYDSMPVERRLEWEPLFSLRDEGEQRERIEAYLNAGYGACWLREARIATLVEQCLLEFDGQRYRLLAWVIMPNHVHALIEAWEGYPLAAVVHTWKSYSAHRANELLGRTGHFWHRDYFDRYVRNQRHLEHAIRYIHDNPVKAGLVERAEDWAYSSARWMEGRAGTLL